MKKTMTKIMLIFVLIIAMLPAVNASAATVPLPWPDSSGFYEDITGSGTLVVNFTGGNAHPNPDAGGAGYWSLTIVGPIVAGQPYNPYAGPGGPTLYHQNMSSHAVLHNLPQGTYRVFVRVGPWASITDYSATFQ
ncbi:MULTISPECIES: hypothetical protein [Paenibacillus]|uniref:Uncharacterized protein n=1 Tax=Paenibacillus arenosi TaxID=2774142 RepID=A0ABR9B316_9BACL|nr:MULTISPECIES: hypothetical protein [Paenibacillus]MBD8500761.1 hypothetical protein [Paenibacillus arenosi]